MTTASSYKHIGNVMTSFRNSTNLTIALKGETIKFEGRNGGHCKIEVTPGHGRMEFIELNNDKYKMFITSADRFPEWKASGDAREVVLPAHHLPELTFPASYPLWAQAGRLVRISWFSDFIGFRPDKAPVFGLEARIVFTNRDLETVFTRYQDGRHLERVGGWLSTIRENNEVIGVRWDATNSVFMGGDELPDHVKEELDFLGWDLPALGQLNGRCSAKDGAFCDDSYGEDCVGCPHIGRTELFLGE